ncbi:hypothetical protein TNCV_3963541 [Trichonephila clavipes]|nr:hypothetical protein TNCV_3963541 [Trichonephila clavipes]
MDRLKFKLEVVEALSTSPPTNKSILTDDENIKVVIALAKRSNRYNPPAIHVIVAFILAIPVISRDGTWKTRGYSSRVRVCDVIGHRTEKVIEVEAMSSYWIIEGLKLEQRGTLNIASNGMSSTFTRLEPNKACLRHARETSFCSVQPSLNLNVLATCFRGWVWISQSVNDDRLAGMNCRCRVCISSRDGHKLHVSN